MILKEYKDSLGQNVAENHTFQIKRLKAFSFPKPCLGNHIVEILWVQLSLLYQIYTIKQQAPMSSYNIPDHFYAVFPQPRCIGILLRIYQ